MIKKFIVEIKFNGFRLDDFVTSKIGLTKNQVHKLIANDQVLVNNVLVKKSNILKSCDLITINLSTLIEKSNFLFPINLNLEIIYEDDWAPKRPKYRVILPITSAINTVRLRTVLEWKLSRITAVLKSGLRRSS
ncbi:MAG: S4 domain-containing protein [Pigeon pea little leaf phytoplasma]|nr:S4 domain-containing protein ['Bituminaria bituminosa' little leaf phytoplasma]MDO8024033.1 S4 domain-containing protein ['Bituminaria bituminosa' little leaf phytoplasma]MDV3161613.1 S4 domain-containing protein [Pigeon pea little leaf phytoplasma]MDV3195747.1 S4 domain-containing protein [Pigeon pea little leaf phytoplasma]